MPPDRQPPARGHVRCWHAYRGPLACPWACWVLTCHQIKRATCPWACRCWLAYPWAGGLPGVRAGAGCCGVPARGPVAVLVGVPVPECHQIDTRPARGCAGCWRAYPVGRRPAWRACRCRWAVPWVGCLPGVRVGAGGPTCGAMCVPVPECHQIDARPARGRAGAGWPTPESVRLPRGQRQPVPW